MPLLSIMQASDEGMDENQEADERDEQSGWIDDNSSALTMAGQYKMIPFVVNRAANRRKEENMTLLTEIWGEHWHKKLGEIGPKQLGVSFICHLTEFAEAERDMDKVVPVLKRMVEERLEKYSHIRWLNYPHLITKDIRQARKQYHKQAEQEGVQQAAQGKSQQVVKSGRLEELLQKMDTYSQQMKEATAALQGAVNLLQGAASNWASMKGLFMDTLKENEKDKLQGEADGEINNENALQTDGEHVLEVDDRHVVGGDRHEPVRERSAAMHRGSSTDRKSVV